MIKKKSTEPVVRTASSSTIRPCACTNAYQDAKYGKGMRVHNAAKPRTPGAAPPWRCTVCTNVKG